LEISSDREHVEKAADYEILGVNVIQKSNKLARQGDYKQAQVISKAFDNRLVANSAKMSGPQMMQMQDFRSNIN